MLVVPACFGCQSRADSPVLELVESVAVLAQRKRPVSAVTSDAFVPFDDKSVAYTSAAEFQSLGQHWPLPFYFFSALI